MKYLENHASIRVTPGVLIILVCVAHAPSHYAENDSIFQIQDILRGIQDLHQSKILHGGIQPSNILINHWGRPVLSDFSLAKPMTSDAMVAHTRTNMNQIRYQAPEISASQPMSAASDIYSWAMSSLEVLSGCTSRRIGS